MSDLLQRDNEPYATETGEVVRIPCDNKNDASGLPELIGRWFKSQYTDSKKDYSFTCYRAEVHMVVTPKKSEAHVMVEMYQNWDDYYYNCFDAPTPHAAIEAALENSEASDGA